MSSRRCSSIPGHGLHGGPRLRRRRGRHARDGRARRGACRVDEDGACVPSTRVRATLAYLTPAHQFPLGVCMPMTRRQQWLEWARTVDAVIFEDDYDSEFRYSGRPVSALQGLDRDGSVVFAGSFSKVLCASLRLGYLVVPSDLVDPAAAMLSVASRHASASRVRRCSASSWPPGSSRATSGGCARCTPNVMARF